MKTTDKLIQHLKKEKNETLIKTLKSNSLFYNIGHVFQKFGRDDYEFIENNRKLSLIYQYELVKINRIFSSNNIDFLVFKGIILSQILYGNIFERICNDIDIYVSPKQYDTALNILMRNGYRLKNEDELNKQHHIALIKADSIVLELHKNIYNPAMNINESYLHNNLSRFQFGNCQFSTFNITATFIHLIYHLYMDTYLIWLNQYNIFSQMHFPKATRFLYRAYEIALFSELYYDLINWDDFKKDLKNQELRLIFKKMIIDINKIFPDAIPKDVLRLICTKHYNYDKRDTLYEALLNKEFSIMDINDGEILSAYVEKNWEKRKESNLCIYPGRRISFTSNTESNKKFACNITMEKQFNKIKLTFLVVDDDLYVSEVGNYNTLMSDGIHLLFCSTNSYTYNSIFLFPKNIDEKIRVIAYDCLNENIISREKIECEIEIKKGEYKISTVFTDAFLDSIHATEYCYIGAVISNCSRSTGKMEEQLKLTSDETQWFNPIFFAKMFIN